MVRKATVEPDSDGGRAKQDKMDGFIAPRILFPWIRSRYTSNLWESDVNKERRFSAQVNRGSTNGCRDHLI